MVSINVNNRPFASDLATGFQLPDGIFVNSIGRQRLNAHFTNGGAALADSATAYVEGTSHPGLVVTPATHSMGQLNGGASRLLDWEVDCTHCPPGEHLVSMIADQGGTSTRSIKKIFVVGMSFDSSDDSWLLEVPEGSLKVRFGELVGPRDACCERPGKKPRCCCPKDKGGKEDYRGQRISIAELFEMAKDHDPGFDFCLPGYLPKEVELLWIPNPGYEGQYSDLPFQDPWWKVLLCILAVVLLIAAAIEAANNGDSVTISTGGGTPSGSPVENCCEVQASGGSSSYVAAGLVAGAAAAATAAAMSDDRDTFRRAQDATPPGVGETTLEEFLKVVYSYPEPVALGHPFRVNLDWAYERRTTGGTYTANGSDSFSNIHVLRRYEITAPDVFVNFTRDEWWTIDGVFWNADDKVLTGDDLLVQCFLEGPNGEWRRLVMQDDGLWPDDKHNDGHYTATYSFRGESPGLWRYYVIAQDTNHAKEGMEPEEAAKIIGGMVLTHQLTIDFNGGECRFVPDGYVNVIV